MINLMTLDLNDIKTVAVVCFTDNEFKNIYFLLEDMERGNLESIHVDEYAHVKMMESYGFDDGQFVHDEKLRGYKDINCIFDKKDVLSFYKSRIAEIKRKGIKIIEKEFIF